MTWSCPLARAGLRRLPASIAPSAPPAPTRLWTGAGPPCPPGLLCTPPSLGWGEGRWVESGRKIGGKCFVLDNRGREALRNLWWAGQNSFNEGQREHPTFQSEKIKHFFLDQTHQTHPSRDHQTEKSLPKMWWASKIMDSSHAMQYVGARFICGQKEHFFRSDGYRLSDALPAFQRNEI